MKIAKVGATLVVVAVTLLAIGTLRPLDVLPAHGRTSTEAGADALAARAMTLLQAVRADADPTVIPEARLLIERSLEAQPRGNFPALVAAASLANLSHDFSGSVEWSRKAIRVNPYGSAPYGLLGDALFELGRYRASDAAYQKMIDTRPDVGSYVRASYSAQFHGDYRSAHRALQLALRSTHPVGEEAAWLHHQIGDVLSAQGRFAASERENRIGMRAAPGYVPPTVGVAEALISQGELRPARRILNDAVENLPAVEYLVTLGDVSWALGDRAAAHEAYAAGATRLELYRDSGVKPDVDFILFYADHGLRPRAALREARAIYADRPTAATADALAWMLRSAGHPDRAERYSRIALRSTTQPDALMNFHAAVIAADLGDEDRARRQAEAALRIDPNFSLLHHNRAANLLRRDGRA